jgi:hypothetical protein
MHGHDELDPGGPGMGGRRRGMRGGGPGERMLLPLIDFFRTTAAA